MSRAILLIALATMCLCVMAAERSTTASVPESEWSSVLYDSNSQTYSIVKHQRAPHACAVGFFTDSFETIGSARLYIWTNPEREDRHQMGCAGFLEGWLSGHRIKDYYRSYRESTFPNQQTYEWVLEWVKSSREWTIREYKSEERVSPFWKAVGLTVEQLEAMEKGYNEAVPDFPLTSADLWMLNSIGDMDDLIPAMQYQHSKSGPNGASVPDMCDTPACILEAESRSHCSAIIKPINGELYAAHDMWASYLQMLMVWKEYDLGLKEPKLQNRHTSFSSWPGMVSSEDDFYITGAQLVVLETTNNVYNLSLYSRVHPHSLLSWVRAVTSNYLASNPDEWHSTMRKHNSGTYNNQWMVIDMKKPFADSKNTTLRPGTLVIGSQLPNYYHHADVTSYINSYGYWPSYNVPYFHTAWVLSGYEAMSQKYGETYTWHGAPRARVFKQRQGDVHDLNTLKKLMRYNDFEHDPIAKGCPMNQLASRGDLSPKGLEHCYRDAFGAVNSKITSSSRIAKYEAEIVAGPTHDTQPVFSWTPEIEAEFPTAHYGQPKTFNFDWQTVKSASGW